MQQSQLFGGITDFNFPFYIINFTKSLLLKNIELSSLNNY